MLGAALLRAAVRPRAAARGVRALASSAPKGGENAPLLGHQRPAGTAYTEHQAKKGRPLSPHVTIYAFPTIAISSITNRVTGAGLAVGCYGIGIMGLFGGDPAAMMTAIGASGLGTVAKFSVAFPLTYHYVCGIRHIVWDHYVVGFNNDSMAQSSLLVAGVSLAISGGAALL